MKKFISTIFISFTILFLVIGNVSAMKVEDISPTDYVTDYTNTLTSEQILEISKILGNIEKEKSYQIGVVVIDKMEDEFGKPDYIEHYAVKLYEKMGLGTKEKDEGMLWLISKDDRQMRMEVGYGLEPILTDGYTKSIQDVTVRPYFKNNDYYGGIKRGVEAINDFINVGPNSSFPVDLTREKLNETTEDAFYQMMNFLFNFLFIFLIIGINIIGWLVAILGRTKSWWLGGVATFIIGFPILFFGFGLNIIGDIILFIFTLTGFLFDYLVSKNYKYWEQKLIDKNDMHGPDWWAGGTWGPGSDSWNNSSSGSGFGGFGGGGMSGGGGSSSSW